MSTLSPLNKKLARDLRKHWAQVGAIIVVVALGVIMFSGPLLAQKDLRDSINNIYRRTNYEDFSVSVASAPTPVTGQLAAVPNVKAAEGRLVRDLQARVRGDQLTLRATSLPDVGKPSVNGLIVESGTYPPAGEPDACLVEHHLTSELHLKPGDRIVLESGGRQVTLRMTGSAVSPEYLRLARSRAEYVSDPAQFGVVFVRYSELAGLLDQQGQLNNFVATVKNKSRLEETMEAASLVLKPYNVVGLTSGSDEPATSTLNLEINDVGKLALFFAVLLLLVASLALYITMTQIVFSQQRQIGVTRALGYERRPITTHYLGYGVVLGIAGGMVGVLCGYYVSRLIIRIYAGIFDLPLITISFFVVIVLAGLGVALLFAMVGSVVPARHAVRMKPAEAMRVEAGLALAVSRGRRSGRRTLSERMGLPAWLRIAFRNLFRNRRRTLLTCLGVLATIALLVTAAGGKDSLDHAVNKYLHGVLRWDVASVWSAPIGPEVLDSVKTIPGVTAAEPIIDAPARILLGKHSADVQVQAFQRGTTMHGSYPTPGSAGVPGPGQIVLNRGITKKLPVKIGDKVTLSTPVGSARFEVAGFVSEPFGGVAYVSLAYIQTVLKIMTGESRQFNAIVVRCPPDKQNAVADALRKYDGVYQVITKARVLKVFEDLVNAVKTLFFIFYVMAAAMGFAVLFSMITVNLFERRREIATMRTLGASQTRIFGFVTVETVVVVVVALIPGILLGRLLEWICIWHLISSDRLAPDSIISGVTVAVIVVATLVVMVLSELPSMARLSHMDLASVTKERAD